MSQERRTLCKHPLAVAVRAARRSWSSRPAVSALIGLWAAAAATGAVADDGQPAVELRTLVVQATRVDQPLEEVARSVVVKHRESIDLIQPRSVARVLDYEPNISVSGGPRPDNQVINIRGLEGSRILQTVDGVRQVFESGHRPSYFLDPDLLDSVEVVRGPVSSLWGSGAVGGVVAQNTVAPAALLQPGRNLGGFVKSGFNDNNEQWATTAALAGRSGKIDWLASGYYRDGDDLEHGDGTTLDGSSYRDRGVLGKVLWHIDEIQSLTLNYRQARAAGAVPMNAAAQLNATSNTLIDRINDARNVSLDYRINGASPLLDARAMAYWNEVEMEERRVSDGRRDNTELDVYGFYLNNRSEWQGLTFLYGVDGYREEFKAQRAGASRPQPPEATSDTWGAFIQASVPLAESWRLDFGARYDRFSTEAKQLKQDRSDSQWSPSAALVWQPTANSELILRHDRAFRAPGAEELYTTGAHFCMGANLCNTFLPNPDLDPEHAANTELLGRMHFEQVLGGALTLTGSVFLNRVDDFIEQIVTDMTFFPVMDPGNTTWVNVDEAELKGFELVADYRVDALRWLISYGQTRGEDRKTGEDLTNIPADKLVNDISYGFSLAGDWVTGLRLTHARPQNRTDYTANTAGVTYDSYSLADLYVMWEPEWIDGLRLNIAINNLSDKHYRRAWQELYESGREVTLSARYMF